jgi:glycosyltransferase involved in cell wall biosynthesis
MTGTRTPARVAFVSDAVWPYNTGGKEQRLYEIGRRLAATGRQVDIYTMRWWDGPGTVVHDGMRYHAICPRLPLYSGSRRSMAQALLFGVATLRLVRADFDVLDVDHMPLFPLFAARAVCALRRKTLIGTWHEVWGARYWRTYLGAAGRIGWLTEVLAVRAPDVIVANSAQTARRLLDIDAGVRVVTVAPGVDLDHVAGVAAAPERTDVVFAGRLLPNKNVDLLLRAQAHLRDQGRRLRVRIIGEGPEREALGSLAARLGVADDVEFRDFFAGHDELLADIKSARVFVLPSDREGFGIVVLEALACDVPVVTIDVEANAARHLVAEGVNGALCAPRPDDLAAAIVRCLEPAVPLRPRASCRERHAHHDWPAVAARLADLFDGSGAAGPTAATATATVGADRG